MRKKQRLKLAKLIIDKSEKCERFTKPELIIKYIQKGIEQETEK